MSGEQVFEPGDVVLQSGTQLRGVRLVYRTHGTLNAQRDNLVVLCTHFGATHRSCEYLFGPGRPLDPARYCIVIPNMLGNGASSSPSNSLAPFDRGRFPGITVYDNVALQHRLVTEVLGVREVALALGHSMGALQAYHWAAAYPDMVRRLAPICGAARVSRHNFVFLEGMKAVLTSHPDWCEGFYDRPPTRALRALGRAWAAWPPSQHFYRQEAYRTLGFATVEDFLVGYWETTFGSLDANDVLAQIWTWQHADLGAHDAYEGSFERALASIRARAAVMPSRTDTYFPWEDSAYEVSCMTNARLCPIESSWGHWAGSGRNPDDLAFIDRTLAELLASA